MTEKEAQLLVAVQLANRDHYWPSDTKCSLRQVGPDVEVCIECMYEHAPATLQTLTAIGNCFGTDRVDVGETTSVPGCESCDYGSEYCVYFSVRGATL